MDALGFGFKVTMWMLGKTAQLAGKGVGAAMAASGQAMQGKPVDVHQYLQSQRPYPTQGATVKPIACPSCHVANETGQVECYKCGKSLLEGLISPAPIPSPSQTNSYASGQALGLVVCFALAFMLMLFGSVSGASATLGLILFFVCIAWGGALIRAKLSGMR